MIDQISKKYHISTSTWTSQFVTWKNKTIELISKEKKTLLALGAATATAVISYLAYSKLFATIPNDPSNSFNIFNNGPFTATVEQEPIDPVIVSIYNPQTPIFNPFPIGVTLASYQPFELIGKNSILDADPLTITATRSLMQDYIAGYIVEAKGKNLFEANSKWHHAPRTFEGGWEVQSIHIPVGDQYINAMIIDNPSTRNSNRWVLHASRNFELFEYFPTGPELKQKLHFLKELNASGIYFNYPSCGSSDGSLSPETLVNAHRAILRHLEDLGATHILCYGTSLGGAVQAISLDRHLHDVHKKNVHYALFADRTFGKMSDAAKGYLTYAPSLVSSYAGSLVASNDWELDAATAYNNLKVPQLIAQYGKDGDVKDDSWIPVEASLAKQVTPEDHREVFLVDKPHFDLDPKLKRKPCDNPHTHVFSKETQQTLSQKFLGMLDLNAFDALSETMATDHKPT